MSKKHGKTANVLIDSEKFSTELPVNSRLPIVLAGL
jgi:hypothetical protein